MHWLCGHISICKSEHAFSTWHGMEHIGEDTDAKAAAAWDMSSRLMCRHTVLFLRPLCFLILDQGSALRLGGVPWALAVSGLGQAHACLFPVQPVEATAAGVGCRPGTPLPPASEASAPPLWGASQLPVPSRKPPHFPQPLSSDLQETDGDLGSGGGVLEGSVATPAASF